MNAGSDQQKVGSPAPRRAAAKPFDKLFSDDETVERMTIGRVAEWFKSKEPGQLRLPPIQRSLVWRNEQVVNYWDSLLRGYPAGMMMVKRATSDGRNVNNKTESLTEPAFHLFDGQQRLFSLLLGLGEGALSESLRLWIDIGEKTKSSEDRLFVLRMNSTGQPFGYRSDKPNEKPRVEERHEKHLSWPKKDDGKPERPDIIFRNMASERPGNLSSAKYAVQLSFIMVDLMAGRRNEIRDELLRLSRTIPRPTDIDELLTCLQKTIDAEIIVKLVDSAILDENNYRRFFARLGQGGTRLSDEELIYSLIKDRYPHVHDRVAEIVRDNGRLASEVDLVLGALRVAQALAPRHGATDREKVARPTPERVQSLYVSGATETEQCFETMLPNDVSAARRMQTAIARLRGGLLYDATSNAFGLPSMLLARLPRDLLDVLLLFTFKRGEDQVWKGEHRTMLIAFVLHWLLFVGYDDKAADHTFLEAGAKDWCFGQNSVAALLHHFETSGIARHAPRSQDWPDLRREVDEYGSMLAQWDKRFSSKDSSQRPPGEALRMLSTHSELKRRALTWIQRHYVTQAFPNYDPTSTHDDDLPFDLDHIIPHELFGFWWTNARKPLGLSGPEESRFKDLRGTVGDSLGNLRWLAAADNRGRGMGQIEDERPKHGNALPLDDHIDRRSWNRLINEDGSAKRWTKDDVAIFQHLIDCRTLSLTEMLMEESGITNLIGIADCLKTSPEASAEV
jgi:hypothetical protein